MCVDDVVRLRVEPCMERVQILAEELKVEFFRKRRQFGANNLCTLCDLTHSFIHMTWRFVI